MPSIEATKRWILAHPEKVKEYQRNYLASVRKDPDKSKKRREALVRWQKNNPDKVREYRKKFRSKEYRDKYPQLSQKKRAMKRIIARDGTVCKKCGTTERLTLQHKIPRCIGGLGTNYNDDNLEILCLPCNIKDYQELVKKALKFYFEHNK